MSSSVHQQRTLRWRFADELGHFKELPPARNKGLVSVVVWLALSNGSVERGECIFSQRAWPVWFTAGDDGGSPARDLSIPGAPRVQAWTEVEPPPPHPKAKARRKTS